MTKQMMIDYTHPEETRVALTENGYLQDFEIETTTKKELKSNIYLAKVARVEPSLQVAFVEYGGGRHGFLPFSEIHPDYYQIPAKDKEVFINAMKGDTKFVDSDMEELDGDSEKDFVKNKENRHVVETFADDDEDHEKSFEELKKELLSKYKIQDVIKPRQLLLIQVEKEERGNKGAAVTTYLSLAGRFCVFMPNSGKKLKYGVSRKISYRPERRRIKDILSKFKIAGGQTVIVRTAGEDKSKKELKKDYDFLMSVWEEIKEKTVHSEAPALIHDDGNLLKRAFRDMLKEDIEEVIIDGDKGFEIGKDLAKGLGIKTKIITNHKGKVPLFLDAGIERQIEAMHSPIVQLKSGAYLVIDQTEALVSIDVNSGRSTKERDIDSTVLKTNIEAARGVARQLKMRDMSGLIVIDFIDMSNPDDNYKLEQEMRKALKDDRSRVQMGRINNFGLMILSRQRLKPSFIETSYNVCPHCEGTGLVPSVQTAGVMTIRHIEEALLDKHSDRMVVSVPSEVGLYILNQKRYDISNLEDKYNTSIVVMGDDTLMNYREYKVERFSLNKNLDGFLKEKESVGSKKNYNKKGKQDRDTVKNTRINKRNNPANKKSKKGMF